MRAASLLPPTDYETRRSWIADYFDRRAVRAWTDLTSDAPVGFVRGTVRAGRDRMRATLLRWLPADLTGMRLLDAGCGTGALAVEAAARGAHVIGIDLSPTLIEIARARTPAALVSRVELHAGDMLDPSLGEFDDIVAMDSLIHYAWPDTLAALRTLHGRARRSVSFTIAPRTMLLAAMHAMGKAFPRGTRAPSIQPIAPSMVRDGMHGFASTGWGIARSTRVSSGFYTSEAYELRHVRGGPGRPEEFLQ
jgi:magnesium-protoporphyrin O-methyltransferase